VTAAAFPRKLDASGGALYAGVTAALFADAAGPARWTAVLAGGALLGAGWWLAPRTDPRGGLIAVAVGAVLFRLLLLPAPGGSTDVYRYLWDGRVQAAGINPYAHAPTDPALVGLRDRTVWPRINHRDDRTIYPPAAQATFRAAHAIGLRTPTGFTAVVIAADLAAIGLLVRLVRRAGRDPRLAVVYAWHPLALLGFAHAAHLESFVVLTVLAAALAWRAGRPARTGALLGLAASLKLLPLVLLPAFLRGRDGRWRWRDAITTVVTALAVLAAGYLPYLPGADDAIGYLPGFLAEEGYTDGAGFLPLAALGLDGRLLGALVMTAVAVAVLRSRRAAAARAAWLLGALLVITTPAQSWYAAPLVAMAVAGGAGAAWPWFGLGLEAGLAASFFRPERLPLHLAIRGVAAAAMTVVALLASRMTSARRALLGTAGR
jgi:hypothetical protein